MRELLNILKKNNLIKTKARVEILGIFLNSRPALSEPEIQEKLDGACDRATIFRTLNLFADKGILHEITTDGPVRKFTLKKSPERHLHFKCNLCGHIICLTGTELPEYNLPEGYKEQEAQFLIKGICKECYES